MPLGLAPLLEKLKIDELSPPLKLGKGFCIVKLIKFILAVLMWKQVIRYIRGS